MEQSTSAPNVTESEVHKILSSVDVSKSTGHDRIPNKLLKDAADIVSYPLALTFNTSIDTGTYSHITCSNFSPLQYIKRDAKQNVVIIDQFQSFQALLQNLSKTYHSTAGNIS